MLLCREKLWRRRFKAPERRVFFLVVVVVVELGDGGEAGGGVNAASPLVLSIHQADGLRLGSRCY